MLFVLLFFISLFFMMGLFIMPFFGGCLLFSTMLVLFSFFLIFISINFVWIFLIICGVYVVINLHKLYKWYKLPDYSQYISTNHSINCSRCHSENTYHLGLFYSKSKFRFYLCRSCGFILYKFKLI
jgi:hypothetical protein